MLSKPLEKVSIFCRHVIFFIYMMLISYIVFANINTGKGLSLKLMFLLAGVFSLAIYCLPGKHRSVKSAVLAVFTDKKWLVIIAVIGLVLRLLPFLPSFVWTLPEYVGDCGVHFWGAQQLVSNGVMNDKNAWYESLHPQLYSYTLLLTLFLKLFRNITAAILFSNVLFDCISIYFLSKILGLLKKKPEIGFVFWWLNPFFIVMCWLPMAIIVVNTILMISVYFGIMLSLKHAESEKCSLWAVLFGLSVFVGNLFRPMFYVVLIAEVIVLGLQFFEHKNKLKKTVLVLLIVFVCAMLPTKVINACVTSIQGFEIPENRIGWNFYVGANFNSRGKWNSDDKGYFWYELLAEHTADEAEEILFQEGLQRYKDMSPYHLITHLTNKFGVLYCDVGNASVRDLRDAFANSDQISRYLTESTWYYYLILIVSVFGLYCRKGIKRAFTYEDLFPVLIFIGLSMAYMLVEVMNRYASMSIALLILILGMGLSDALNDKVTQTNLPISKSALSDDSVD